METPDALGLIAGSGVYPLLVAESARGSGVRKITAAAFTGETHPKLATIVDEIEWMRVGQLGRMLDCFHKSHVRHAIMAGQIAPKNLFALRPDWKALLLLARLKKRNAETIFGAIADELARGGIELLPATTFLEKFLAPAGLVAGREPSKREAADIAYGFEIAQEISRLDIGQTVIVKNGTVLAVEAFEGTNEAITRGGRLAGKGALMIKVAKPNQDFRFDLPVIGVETIRTAAAANVRVIAIAAGQTLLLEKEKLISLAVDSKITIVGR